MDPSVTDPARTGPNDPSAGQSVLDTRRSRVLGAAVPRAPYPLRMSVLAHRSTKINATIMPNTGSSASYLDVVTDLVPGNGRRGRALGAAPLTVRAHGNPRLGMFTGYGAPTMTTRALCPLASRVQSWSSPVCGLWQPESRLRSIGRPDRLEESQIVAGPSQHAKPSAIRVDREDRTGIGGIDAFRGDVEGGPRPVG